MEYNLKLAVGQKLLYQREGMVRPDEVTFKLRTKTGLHYFSVLSCEGYGTTFDLKQGESLDAFIERQEHLWENAKTDVGTDRLRDILIRALRQESLRTTQEMSA